ncbi:MAG: carboxypeptidase-like regulatory domain-containing protein [Acidobacteriota bacterium]
MKTGSKFVIGLLCALLVCAAAKPPLKDDAPHAVVAGTVFRENGFSLPGATVTLAVKDAPKVKKLQVVSDGRGEFAFRVPPEAATFVVGAAMKGFQYVEKEASVSGEVRIEVTLTLPAESK